MKQRGGKFNPRSRRDGGGSLKMNRGTLMARGLIREMQKKFFGRSGEVAVKIKNQTGRGGYALFLRTSKVGARGPEKSGFGKRLSGSHLGG